MDTQWWASRTCRFGMAVGLAVGLLAPGFVVLAEQGPSSSTGRAAPTVPDPPEDSAGQSSAALPPPSAMPTSEPADPTTTTVPATDNTTMMTAGAAATTVSVPGAVRFLSGAAAAEGGVVYLSWAAPLDDGGAEVVDYVVEQSIDGGGSWTTVGDGVSAAPSLAVDGLVNGTAYRFRVAAVNSAGTGAFADSVEVTPEAPVSFGVSVAAVCVDGVPQASFALDGSGAVIVTFGGVPRQLQIEWPTWSAVWPSVGGVFVPEVSWNAVVAGESGAPVDSGVLALPADCEPPVSVPGAVRFLSGAAAAEGGVVYLSWAAPLDDGGAEVVDYVVEQSIDGGGSWTTVGDGVSAAPSLAVDGLVNGTAYRFRVAAVNSAGTGAFADTVEVTPEAPVSVPGVVRSLGAVPGGSGQVRLTWLAPASNGGAAVTDYVIQRSLNGTGGWVAVSDGVRATTGYTVSSLSNGTRYWFRVSARNAAGTGPVSVVVNAVPRTMPGVVRSLGAVPGGSGQVRLTWLAPASNGGAAVTDYVIQRSLNGTGGWVAVSDGVRATTGYTVSSLSNGTRYWFRVSARNAAGTGPVSVVVNAVASR